MAQRPENPVPASLQGRQRDKDTTAVIYGGMGMETKHTPGPWSLMDRNGDFIRIESSHPDYIEYQIADVIDVNGYEENEANARLIVAAPELLEAAKAVTGMLELFIDEQRIKEAADGCARRVEEGAAKLEALRAAISKAEGR